MSAELFEANDRDKEIIRLIGEGWSFRDVARKMSITAATVSGCMYRERERQRKAAGLPKAPRVRPGKRVVSSREERAPVVDAPIELPADHVPVSLLDIRDGQCHFPIEGGYCGLEAPPKQQYCDAHRRRMVSGVKLAKVGVWY